MRLFPTHTNRRALGLLASLALAAIPAGATNPAPDLHRITVAADGTVTELNTAPDQKRPSGERESIFPEGSRSLAASHFTWGAEAGASIDVTAHNQSTFDADVMFGYKNKFIRIIGIGGGIHRAFGSGDNYIPLYLVFRSSFSTRPQPLFFSFKAGYSFNTIGNAATYGDTSASVGMGINLASGHTFASYIVLGYGFRHYSDRHKDSFGLSSANVSLAQLSIGISF